MSKSGYCREYELAHAKLASISQQHLLRFWLQLSIKQRTHLHDQVESLDIDLFLKQRSILHTGLKPRNFAPLVDVVKATTEEKALGLKAIADGEVGCLVVAGGQGTRLGFSGPKGAFPVTRFKQKSLFQILAEKTLAAGKLVGRNLPLAIMTSHHNHQATLNFFEENHYFGLQKHQVAFFYQK
jgi:UDP-N-acetylglucosamine/UDP-N-acetylgalactosamine diphosphorylase